MPGQNYNIIVPREPSLAALEGLMGMNAPYYRSTQLLAIKRGSDPTRFFVLRSWDTKHPFGGNRTCAASVWECDAGEIDIAHAPEAVVETGGAGPRVVVTDLTLSSCARQLLDAPYKRHIVHGYTGNDPATFCSISFGHHYLTHSTHVAVHGDARLAFHRRRAILRSPAEHIAVALECPDGQLLNIIIDGKVGNPADAHDRVRRMDPLLFKCRYLTWLERKDEPAAPPSGAYLMSADERAEWTRNLPLLHLAAASKYLAAEPYNLRVALSCQDAALIQIDEHGVPPPAPAGSARLEWIKTPAGQLWFVGLARSHGEPQQKILAELGALLAEARYDAAMIFLTTALAENKPEHFGLVKRIVLRMFTDPKWSAPDFSALINRRLADLGLDWRINPRRVVTVAARDAPDSFAVLGHVGKPFY